MQVKLSAHIRSFESRLPSGPPAEHPKPAATLPGASSGTDSGKQVRAREISLWKRGQRSGREGPSTERFLGCTPRKQPDCLGHANSDCRTLHIRSLLSPFSHELPFQLRSRLVPCRAVTPNVLLALQVDLEVSSDGGATFAPLRTPAPLRTLTGRATEFQAACLLPRDATHVRVRQAPAAGPSPPPPAASPTPQQLQYSRASPQNENRPPEERKQNGPGAVVRAGGDESPAGGGPSVDDPLWEGYFARVASWGASVAAVAPTAVVQSRLPRTARRRDVDLQVRARTAGKGYGADAAVAKNGLLTCIWPANGRRVEGSADSASPSRSILEGKPEPG